MIHDLQITVLVIQGCLPSNQTTWRLCVCHDKLCSLLVRCVGHNHHEAVELRCSVTLLVLS